MFSTRRFLYSVAAGTVSVLALSSYALALKYAPPQYWLEVGPSIPGWQPGDLTTVPEEEFNLVGADVMDELPLLLSFARARGGVNIAPVYTHQVAPTVLLALGLDPERCPARA